MRLAPGFLLAAVALTAACGSTAVDEAARQDPEPAPPTVSPTSPSVASEASAPVTSIASAPVASADDELTPASTCRDDVSPSTLSDAQFAFVGTVTSIEEQVHPWTTDPENPDRPDEVSTTTWVTFDVAGWYTTDWGPTFSVWAPMNVGKVGDELAVAGDAYHTEMLDFSGQSGEIEICTSVDASESSLDTWANYFGQHVPPTTPPQEQPPVASTKVFGEYTEPCPATVLTNGVDDETKRDLGVACFMTEYDAGRPVVWDIVVATVEGDPVPIRYDYDGNTVTITDDASFDNFGSGEASERRCSGVRSSTWLPEGVDCITSVGSGFLADTLPWGA